MELGIAEVSSLVCMMWSRAVNCFIVVGNEPQLPAACLQGTNQSHDCIEVLIIHT